jgi:hypothetical protein
MYVFLLFFFKYLSALLFFPTFHLLYYPYYIKLMAIPSEFTFGAVSLESPDKPATADRIAKMMQVAEELKAKKASLNLLAETIVTRREALIKAQEEYKRFILIYP